MSDHDVDIIFVCTYRVFLYEFVALLVNPFNPHMYSNRKPPCYLVINRAIGLIPTSHIIVETVSIKTSRVLVSKIASRSPASESVEL